VGVNPKVSENLTTRAASRMGAQQDKKRYVFQSITAQAPDGPEAGISRSVSEIFTPISEELAKSLMNLD
jgi:hypothetical protein